MDSRKLQDLYRRHPGAKQIFGVLATRDRHREMQDLRRLREALSKQGLPAANSEILEFYRELQEAGVGTLIPARGVTPARFRWKYDMRLAAKTAMSRPPSSPSNSMDGAAPKLITVYPLRPDARIRIELPSDVSQPELDELASFIRDLRR